MSSPDFEILVDGRRVRAQASWTVAAALWNTRQWRFRTSVSGEPRGPLCAMGICFECRVVIAGTPHRRACMELCTPGMEVRTGG